MLGDGGSIMPHDRHRRLIAEAMVDLEAIDGNDILLDAERLRVVNSRLGALLGREATEMMLDALFGRFCLGK